MPKQINKGMHTLPLQVHISVNAKLYVKNPESSELGKKIVQHSILLLDEIGFDAFTFKKLGERIGSNESSLYRYFENKHKLLMYLSSWYWGWMEYRLIMATNNLSDPKIKLNRAIDVLAGKIDDDLSTSHINESVLNRIIILEFSKTFLTKEVDQENREGFFIVYKTVVNRLVAIIQEVDPNYTYARSLASSIVEGSLHQHFLQNHFTTITDCKASVSPSHYYSDLVNKLFT